MMPAPGEKSEMAERLEMVQKVVDSSRSASPRAIQSALAIAKPEKVAKSLHAAQTLQPLHYKVVSDLGVHLRIRLQVHGGVP
jgi:hypothetical protein